MAVARPFSYRQAICPAGNCWKNFAPLRETFFKKRKPLFGLHVKMPARECSGAMEPDLAIETNFGGVQ